MEHRSSARIPIRQTVVVDCPHVGGAAVTLREINLGGMLVDSTMLFLPLYASVMVAFSLCNDERSRDFVLDAMVIRHTADGAALMFSDLDIATLRTLAAALPGDLPAQRNATAARFDTANLLVHAG